MGKVIRALSNKKKSKKMSEILVERRSSNKTGTIANGLKRSKSVRASLRLIGNKLLHHKNADELQMNRIQKSPSLSSIRDSVEFKRNYFNKDTARNLHNWDHLEENDCIETILKTPINQNKKNQLPYLNFKKTDFSKNGKTKMIVTTPPSTIAPKAAAILEIPIEENCEYSVPVLLRNIDIVGGTESSGRRFTSRYGEECDLQGRPDSFAAFQRSALRLSMNGTYHKRKGMTTFTAANRSSTSSRSFHFLRYILLTS